MYTKIVIFYSTLMLVLNTCLYGITTDLSTASSPDYIRGYKDGVADVSKVYAEQSNVGKKALTFVGALTAFSTGYLTERYFKSNNVSANTQQHRRTRPVIKPVWYKRRIPGVWLPVILGTGVLTGLGLRYVASGTARL